MTIASLGRATFIPKEYLKFLKFLISNSVASIFFRLRISHISSSAMIRSSTYTIQIVVFLYEDFTNIDDQLDIDNNYF